MANRTEDMLEEIFKDHEAQLKDKDDEIERLKGQLSTVHNLMYMNGYSDAIDCYDTFGKFNIMAKPNAKARSIVAMLFCEWRKAETRYQEEWKTKRDNRQLSLLSSSSYKAEVLFKQAYKMLKDKNGNLILGLS